MRLAMSRRCAALVLALAPLACAAADTPRPYRVETVAQSLDHPWCIAFLPDGRMLVTERAGRLRVIENGKLAPEPVAGVPPVYARSQGGLFDVLPARDFAQSGTIYLSFAHGDARANATRVVSARLAGRKLENVKEVFTAQPEKSTAVHYGGRMAWMNDGTLLLTLGDGFNWRERAQKLEDHFGTVVRVNADGSVPKDNPFVDKAGAKPEIWTYGHRNSQGLVVDARSGRVYQHEHGARGGDEVNLLQPGKNYGWPLATYGVDYSGAQITPYKEYPGTEQPLLHWTPSIAPSGMTLYDGALFPQWQGDLLVSSLVERSLRRVRIRDGKVVDQETLLTELSTRLRDVRTGPDGALYVLTDAEDGKVLRVAPAK
jgi:aldose sugar dehydrogenase